jgi:transcriptional regulator with XRE-family HTH domain
VVWHVDLAGIDRARLLRGWTRGELARRAHVDAGTVSDMFRRRRRPVLGTVQAICTALGLGLENVIVFDDEAA